MKKILFCLIMITTNIISMAVKNVDLKLATNFGIGLEGGTYYNLYGSSKYNKNSGQRAIFENKVAFTGSLEAKILKSFNINKDLKVKLGAGASIDVNQLHELDKIVKVIRNGKEITKITDNSGQNNVDLPHTGSWGVGLNVPFQSKVKEIGEDPNNWGYGDPEHDDANTQMPKLIELSRKKFYTSLTTFGTIEIEKMLKNFSVYFGVDAGVDILLEKKEETVTYYQRQTEQGYKYTLERRKSRIRPKVKGYTGINYKGFETEIGLGYPQFVTLGIGYRFNF